ncbi:MAG: NUDIX domain-containing protein [Anaerolineae bacterium]
MSDIQYIVNVEGAIVRDARYLLVLRGAGEAHAAGLLSLVGGKVEGAEAVPNILEDTLRREIREEVNLEVDDLVYVHSTAFIADDNQPVIDVVFVCRQSGGTEFAADPAEVAAIFWMTANEVLTNPDMPEWTRESVRRAELMRRVLGW